MSHGGSPNLILTGFMGTGKTAVGRQVARRLGRPFLDMDDEIEGRAGKPVPRIFVEDGQTQFRAMEAALCQELSRKRGLVVATGGGALLDTANRAAMMGSGTVICLTCNPDEIIRRVSHGGSGSARPHGPASRPLLDVPEPRAEIERLLAARRAAYETIPWQIDTTGQALDDVVQLILTFADVLTLPVRHPGGEYPIHLGNGLLDRVGGALRAAGAPAGSRVTLVSNTVVAPLYGRRVEDALRLAGFQVIACTIADGELHKTLATVASLYDQFLDGCLDRSGTVLALGGGVTGDIAGFAAATFMRGVRFAQVPTTLLAMADSSVGGKTGVDLPQGKNLAGAFKHPAMVLIDPTVLATLPPEEIRSGMVEVLKHCIIADPDLFEALAVPPPDIQAPITARQLAQTLQVKIDIVEEDPFELGRRAWLNLGHTTAHALERLSDFSLRHGEAVGIGLVAAARIATELGWIDGDVGERFERVLAAWGLPTRCPPFEAGAIWHAMAHDKKKIGKAQRWVLPRTIGQVEVTEDVPRQVVYGVLQSMGARSEP